MVETKYGKYFVETLPGGMRPEWAIQGGPTVVYLDDKLLAGCNFYAVEMFTPTPPFEGVKWSDGGHSPHIHRDAEILMHLGTDPEDPTDLGAEVVLCMGPEMEEHVITKSTVVYIPPGFVHAPWIVKKVTKPWLFVEINQGPMHTEKSYPQLIAEEERGKYVWVDEGYGQERRVVYPKIVEELMLKRCEQAQTGHE